jgi:hypothetical protein
MTHYKHPFTRNKVTYLPRHRYILAMQRMLNLIENDRPLNYVDNTEPGNKYIDCSIGLCNNSVALWPDAQDHKWPDQFLKQDRIAPLDRTKNCKCPLDTRSQSDNDLNGCFYSCLIFQNKNRSLLPTKNQLIELYNKRISDSLKN